MAGKKKGEGLRLVVVTAPNTKTAVVTIVGTTPYVQNRFGESAFEDMRRGMTEESKAARRGTRPPREFDRDCREATHRLADGSCGIPASGLRAAIIRAASLIDRLPMTQVKIAVFVEADGFDKNGLPLVRITKGKPRKHECVVPQGQTASIRARPMWEAGWEAKPRITWNASILNAESVFNLLRHAGLVGIGAGRNFSKMSGGCGWGSFTIKGEK